jgi:hypothetical protein
VIHGFRLFRNQGQINHSAEKAKCPGPTKKMGPVKAKNELNGAYEGQNVGLRPLKIKTYIVSIKICFGPKKAYIRPGSNTFLSHF